MKLKNISIIMVGILMLAITVSSAIAFEIKQGEYYNREMLPRNVIETAFGEMLQCSDFPVNIVYVWNRDNANPTTSITVSCSLGVIDKFEQFATGGSWIYAQEYTNSRTFTGLSSVRNYKYECYSCPANTVCAGSQLGTSKLVNTQTFVTCTAFESTTNYWKQTVCGSGKIVDQNTWTCKTQCVPNPVYTAPSSCVNGVITTQIIDANNCNTGEYPKTETQSCNVPDCYTDAECGTGYKCNNGICNLIPPPPILCNNGDLICNKDNDVDVCDGNSWSFKEDCKDNGCDAGKCIIEESGIANYTFILIGGISLLILTLVIVMLMRKPKRRK